MNKLEQVFADRKKIEEKKLTEKKVGIIGQDIIEFPKFDEDEEINRYLNQMGLEILNVGLKAELAVGKCLEDVFQKLGNNKTGTYQKFLSTLGIHSRTALRQRMRYSFFVQFTKSGLNKAKEIISVIPIAYLEKLNSLFKDVETKEILLEYFKDENLTVSKFKDLVDTELLEKKLEENPQKEIVVEKFNFVSKWKAISKLTKKVEKLPEDKQKEVLEHLEKIQLIIDESEEEQEEIKEAEIIEVNL